MILLTDEEQNNKQLVDYKYLRDLLIGEIREQIYNNIGEKNIVMKNLDILEKMARGDKYNLIEELYKFGWITHDLDDVERSLYDLNEYLLRTSTQKELKDENIDFEAINKALDVLDKLRDVTEKKMYNLK